MCNVSETNTWGTYLRAITNGDAGNVIAKKTGVPASTISRWFNGELQPKPRQVAVVSRAYGLNPVAALIQAGYLQPDDVALSVTAPRLLQIQDFTELELAQEIVRRIEEGESVMLDTPVDADHPVWARRNNVTPLLKGVPTEEEALELGAVADTGVKEVHEFDDEDEHEV